MEWMIMPFRKFAQFNGRSRRQEFWMWVLFVVIVSTILRTVEGMLGLSPAGMGPPQNYAVGAGGNGPLSGLFGLVVLIPGLAVTARRLHDIDRSGWWMLVPLAILIIGILLVVSSMMGGAGVWTLGWMFLVFGGYLLATIVLVVFLCFDGTRGPNRFGPDPKNPESDLSDVFS
jgi:uncharacterized membrane protein YhaH (DUF805 family)